MTVAELLSKPRTIAVVGMSRSRFRASQGVSVYMQSLGHRIIPVSPHITEALGEKAYPDLESVPEPVEIVNIFRRSEHLPELVDKSIRIGAKVIWIQEGIVPADVAGRARAAGILLVMDRCIMQEQAAIGPLSG